MSLWNKGWYMAVWMLFIVSTAFSQARVGNQQELQLLADNVFHLSEVMLHDAASPPAASRVYAYSLLAAHQVASLVEGRLPELNQRLKVDPAIALVNPPKKTNVSFCSNYAMLEVGRNLMPSGFVLDEKKKALVAYYQAAHHYSDREMAQQIRFSIEIAREVIDYAKSDGYNKLSTYARYTPRKQEGFWYPTPPAYMGAVEPQWQTVRPFFLDSAAQFAPPPPAPFSKDTTSSFYRQMKSFAGTARNRKFLGLQSLRGFVFRTHGHRIKKDFPRRTLDGNHRHRLQESPSFP
jgi:hypothetical protein